MPRTRGSRRRRAPILLDLGVLHEREGRYEEALTALRQAEGFGRAAGDIGTVARAVARRQFVRSHVEGTAQSELQAEAEALLPALEQADDQMAIAEVCFFVGVSSSWLGHQTRAIAMLERARSLRLEAERSGSRRRRHRGSRR